MSSMYRTIQYNFTAGLLSALQEGAVGSAAYQNGLSVAENIFYGPGYGLFRRHGTKYGCEAKVDSIVRPFSAGGVVYMIEFSNLTARLLDEDGEVVGQEVATPYVAADIAELSCVSNQDRLYIVHHGYQPRTMTISDGRLQPPVLVEFVQSQDEPATTGTNRTITKTFDHEGDFPAVQFFRGGRWYLLSTDNDPLMIWASRTYDAISASYRYNDFTLQMFEWVPNGDGGGEEQEVALADLAIAYLNSDMYGTRIRWAMSHQMLLIGTGRTIYADSGNSAVTATTESPFSLSPSMAYGTSGRAVAALGSYVFFPGADNRTLMCVAYSQQYSGYSGTDISAPVSRYLRKGIKTICVTDGPSPMVWVLTLDGNLLACLFDAANGIVAWSVMSFGSDIPVWIDSLQGGDDGTCKLFLIMIRGNKRCIETLDIVAPVNIWEEPHVDCYRHFSKGEDADISHLGRSGVLLKVNVMDGTHEYLASDIASDETLPDLASDGYTGILYTSVISTLRSELPANGTSQGTKRAVSEVSLRMYRSLGGGIAVRPDIDNSESLIVGLPDDVRKMFYQLYGDYRYGQWHRLYTGDKTNQFRTANIDDDRLVIASDDPFPLCVCAIIVKRSVVEA